MVITDVKLWSHNNAGHNEYNKERHSGEWWNLIILFCVHLGLAVWCWKDHVYYTEGLSEQLPCSSEEDDRTERQMGQRLARTGTLFFFSLFNCLHCFFIFTDTGAATCAWLIVSYGHKKSWSRISKQCKWIYLSVCNIKYLFGLLFSPCKPDVLYTIIVPIFFYPVYKYQNFLNWKWPQLNFHLFLFSLCHWTVVIIACFKVYKL